MARRMFFGLDLPLEWKHALRHEQRVLQKRNVEASGWSNPELLHITVVFLGMIEDEQMEVVLEAGREAVAGLEQIAIRTGSYGEFARNKVFWLGLDRQLSDWKKLLELNRRVTQAVLARLPLDLDAKHYRPHITLARKMRQNVDVLRLAPPESLETVVSELCLFESLRVNGELTYPVRERFVFREA